MNTENDRRSKKDVEEIHRLNRTLRALSHSNRALLRALNEEEYMHEVCKIIVEDCGHAMTWIGFAGGDENKTVHAVAHAGFEDGYLETLHVTWADTERGRGPTGTAIRTGKPSFCRNMLTDPKFAPWREEALRRGYASSLVLPLSDERKTFGALTIYFKEPDPFTDPEVKLLSDLADDLAYGINSIRLREAHEKARRALEVSEAQANALIKYAPTGIYELDYRTGRFTSVNDALCAMLGYNREELLSMDASQLLDEDSKAHFADRIKKVLEGEKIEEAIEYTARKKDGTVMYGLLNVSVNISGDEPYKALVIVHDITGRKRAEEFLAETVEALEHERDILQGVMDGAKNSHLVYLDRDFNFVRVNKAYAATCGYQPEEMIGKNHFDLYPDAENEGIFKRVRDTGEAEEYHDKPFKFPDQPGRGVTYWDWTLTPIKGRKGKVEGLVFSLFETTGRVLAERALVEIEARRKVIEAVDSERKRLFDVLETLPAMICLLTPDYHVPFSNRAFRERFGESQGRPCYQYCFGQSEPCKFCEAYNVLKSGKPHQWEVTTPAGDTIAAYDFPFTDFDGSTMILEMDIDVTQRRQIEKELREHRDSLERLVEERTKELSAINSELSRFNQAAVGREIRMIDLKEEVNELCARAGIPPRYRLDFEKNGD